MYFNKTSRNPNYNDIDRFLTIYKCVKKDDLSHQNKQNISHEGHDYDLKVLKYLSRKKIIKKAKEFES